MVRVCFSLSYPFQCGYFLIHLMHGSHSVISRFLAEGFVPCRAVHFVYEMLYMKEGFRSPPMSPSLKSAPKQD